MGRGRLAVSAQERPPGGWARARTPSRVPRMTFPTSTARAMSAPAAGPRKPGRRGGACAWTGARLTSKPSRGPRACSSSSAEFCSPASWCPWVFIASSGVPYPKNIRKRPKAEVRQASYRTYLLLDTTSPHSSTEKWKEMSLPNSKYKHYTVIYHNKCTWSISLFITKQSRCPKCIRILYFTHETHPSTRRSIFRLL